MQDAQRTPPSGPVPDWRHIDRGRRLPFGGRYLDQPYLVESDDGHWVMVATCGSGHEGTPGQSVAIARSPDHGKTWSAPVFLEHTDGPEASYGIPLKTAFGRIYVFYNHNTDNLREVKADPAFFPGGRCERVDTQGHFVFRYSDDHGRTWSPDRFEVPVRAFEIDRENPYGGKVRFFWTVGRAFSANGRGYFPLHKVGGFGDGFITRSEGALIEATNIHTEQDPAKLVFKTLPEGNKGIRGVAGGGPVAEEHSICVLKDGSFFVLFRTTDGHNACAYSRDGGRTWSPSQYMRYHDKRLFKHPRAATFVFPHSSGKYLCWFHNHGGLGYKDRRMVWVSVGTETETVRGNELVWSEPEVLLYSDDLNGSFSYPDLIEANGRTYLTISHKQFGTLHEIDPHFLEKILSGNDDNTGPVVDECILDRFDPAQPLPEAMQWSGLPTVNDRTGWWEDIFTRDTRRGFTLEFALEGSGGEEGCLFDSRDKCGNGAVVWRRADGSAEISLRDGLGECRWSSRAGLLKAGRLTHLALIVDGGPKIVSFVIDGIFDDGGASRAVGYGHFRPTLRKLGESPEVRFPDADRLGLRGVRIHSRALLTCECRQNCAAMRESAVVPAAG